MMSSRKVYVFCPNDIVTGGPDALHQLVYYLNGLGMDADIVYYAYSKKHKFTIPDAYKKYLTSFTLEKDFVDSADNIVVLPEHAVDKLKLFKKSKVFIWWLSVDNNVNKSSFLWKLYFFATLPARVVRNWYYYKKHFAEAVVKTLRARTYSFKKELDNVAHLCASYYAYDYVSKRTSKNCDFCIEPISKFFLERNKEEIENANVRKRSNKILYNPRKSGAFVQELAACAPDLEFEPLKGLTQEELVDKYRSSKLYIDFGPFPGAERMPKEAVLFGCAIITGCNGASKFHGDVPIPDEYKFAEYKSQKDQIVKKIREILTSYDEVYHDFDEYRETVLSLESRFVKSLKELVV